MNSPSDTFAPTLTLNNGVEIPRLGLGVWQAADGAQVEDAVTEALRVGYRLIDTAAIYGNERGVGQALRRSDVPREEIFVTTKLWNSHHAYDDALRAFEESLEKLGCGTVDLYLIHWPLPMEDRFPQAWRAMEKLLSEGRVRTIGVSNFKPAHLERLASETEIVPAVNQIELHPMWQQKETRAYCEARGIAIESYSPLMRGGEALGNPLIVQLSARHGKTPAQIILRWHVQSGFITIPKSVQAARIEENFRVFDFELSPDEMNAIAALDAGRRLGADPDTAQFK